MAPDPLPFVEVDGRRIAYQRRGTGAPLVLLHGFICDSRAWAPQLDALSNTFDVIAWDCPGCGQSDDPPEDWTMGDFAECLIGFLDQLGVTSAHFVGLSWGGTLILDLYRREPRRITSMVVADSYAGWTGSLGPDAAEARLARCIGESKLPAGDWIPQWVPDAFSPGAPKSLLDKYAAIMSDFHPVGFRAMSRALAPDLSGVLPRIAVPTLLIWGKSDSRSPLTVGEAFEGGIAGSRLVVIPNAGHVSNFEQPDAFNAAVREFIR